MMKIYYRNNRGISLDLLAAPYRLQTGDLFDYKWDANKKNTGKIKGFNRGIRSKKLLLGITDKDKKSYYAALNYFCDTVEQDILDEVPGRLYVGDTYINCYVVASTKTNWECDINVLDNEIELLTDGVWITEKLFSFQADVDKSDRSAYLDFPYDFPFDFSASRKGTARLNNDHYAAAHFKMTIFGPVANPKITIDGYTYEVNTSVSENEYLVIDGRVGTVVRVQQDGTWVNEFNNRSFDNSVFRKIPAGKLSMSWSGDFGFDIVLYQERSEPRWS